MRRKLLFTAVLGTALSLGGIALAQIPGTNLGTPQTQPQPGGGVSTGPGAPTSAERLVPGSSSVETRGPPPAGSGAAVPGGGPGTSTVAPTGAIGPGNSAGGGTGGSSR